MLVLLDFKGKQKCRVPKWLLTAWRCGSTGARKERKKKIRTEHQLAMLHSRNVRSLFFVFSVPLRAGNPGTNCPEFLIKPYVRTLGNLEENLGQVSAVSMMLSITFTSLFHMRGAQETTTASYQAVGLGKNQTNQFSFFGGHLESISCMSFKKEKKKKSVKLAANCHGMMIGLCWKRVPEQPDWSSERHKVTYSKCEAWIKHSSFVCCCVLEWFTPCVICSAHCKCLLYILILQMCQRHNEGTLWARTVQNKQILLYQLQQYSTPVKGV